MSAGIRRLLKTKANLASQLEGVALGVRMGGLMGHEALGVNKM